MPGALAILIALALKGVRLRDKPVVAISPPHLNVPFAASDHVSLDGGMPAGPSRETGELSAAFQSWRDAAGILSYGHIRKALSDDPTLARAHLLFALERLWVSSPSRRSLQQAWQYRAQLDARELALLKAYQPSMAMNPDLAATRSDLQRVTIEFPDFDLAVYALAVTDLKTGELEEGRNVLQAFVNRHPEFAAGLQMIALSRALSGDAKGAEASYRQCLKISPYATDCISDLTFLQANEGACSEAEELARSLVSVAPSSSLAFTSLAGAVFAENGSLAATGEILAQGLPFSAPEQRPTVELQDAISLDVLAGHFELALAHAAKLERLLENETDETPHEELAMTIMDIDLEVGDRSSATRVADDFRERRLAWTRSDYFDYDIVPLRVKYLAGFTGAEEFRAQRKEWLRKEANRPPLVGARGLQWVMAYAQAVVTDVDAKEAIDALPSYLPMVDPITRDADSDEPIGVTYLRAGRLPLARLYLERAAYSCRAVDMPISQTRANLYLGELRVQIRS